MSRDDSAHQAYFGEICAFSEDLRRIPKMNPEERRRELVCLRGHLDEAIGLLASRLKDEEEQSGALRPLMDWAKDFVAPNFRCLPPDEMARKAVESQWAPVLLRKLVSGDAEDRFWRLVVTNIPLVISIVTRKSLSSSTIFLGDLIQVGTLGLAEGIARFNPAMGMQLSTYVKAWIRKSVEREIQKTRKGYRLSYGMCEIMSRISHLRADTFAREGRYPGVDEIAATLGVKETRIEEALSHSDFALSLDLESWSDKGQSLFDTLGCGVNVAKMAIEAIDGAKLHRVVSAVMETELNPRERDIVRGRIGMDGEEAMSMKDLGRCHGISGARAGQVYGLAVSKLKTAFERIFREDPSLRCLMA